MNNNSIGLCMIVKNESHVIKDTLENLCSNVNFEYWVISDTGSTDNTKEIITEFFKEKNIPGELHEDEWKDFGHNRSLALEYAFSAPINFVMIFDADDKIEGKLKLPDFSSMVDKNLKLATQFHLRIGKGFTYIRPFIFDNNFKWKFYGVLHEYAGLIEEGPVKSITIEGDYYVDSRRIGNRSLDPDKYKKDAIILENAYKKECEVNGKLKARYAFYCAQSYKDCNEFDKAIEYYMLRTTLGDYQEEVYVSYLYAGTCMIRAGRSEEEIEVTLLNGWESMKIRSECLYVLSEFFLKRKKITKAFLYSNLGRKIAYPVNCGLFLNKDVFDYKHLEMCAMTALMSNRFDASLKCYNKLFQIKKKELDENVLKCTEPLKQTATVYNKFNFKKPLARYYGITLTMTTCKRFDLFEKTVNSLINNVKDLYMVERFICIDDNSSHEDRMKMLDKYPFFEYVFKKPHQKGHVNSMNMIKSKLTDADKFVFHLEDDWVFLTKRKYIGNSIRILKDNPKIGQVLFNKHYAETLRDFLIEGRGQEFQNGAFIIHNYVEEPEKRTKWLNCEYWPHFSFRPSIVRKDVLDAVGEFREVSHFEKDYAHRYQKLGYQSCFHNRIDMLHIGKLTSETNKANAYSLNEVKQF
jgi:glycosyltransferase involved in cell wall biosynthesis